MFAPFGIGKPLTMSHSAVCRFDRNVRVIGDVLFSRVLDASHLKMTIDRPDLKGRSSDIEMAKSNGCTRLPCRSVCITPIRGTNKHCLAVWRYNYPRPRAVRSNEEFLLVAEDRMDRPEDISNAQSR